MYNLALEKGTPVLEKAANEVREKTIEVLDDTQAGMYVKENNYLKFHQLLCTKDVHVRRHKFCQAL